MPDRVTLKILLVLFLSCFRLSLDAQEQTGNAQAVEPPPGAWYFPYENLEQAQAADPARSGRFISLEGDWTYSITAPEKAESGQSFFSRQFDDGSWESISWKPAGPGALTVPLVQTENRAKKIILLRKTVQLEESALENPIFLAVSSLAEATVWINGRELTHPSGAAGRTEYFIGPHLKAGDNLIALKVTASGQQGSDAELASSGIKKLMLYSRPRIHLDGISVRSVLDESSLTSAAPKGLLQLDIWVDNRMDSVRQRFWGVVREPLFAAADFRIQLLDDEGNMVLEFKENTSHRIRGGERRAFRFEGEVPNVKTWSHETPDCYRLNIELLDGSGAVREAVSQQVGFSLVRLEGGALQVNGTAVPLRVFQPKDHVQAFAGREQLMEFVREIKQGNFNAVYGLSYFASPAWHRISNTHGIYVLDRFDLGNPNHPSVVSLVKGQRVSGGAKPVTELELADFLRGTIRIRNHFAFRDLSGYYLEWLVLRNGEVAEEGRVENLEAAPGEVTTVSLGYKTRFYEGNDYFLNLRLKTKAADSLIPADHLVASRQFRLSPYEYTEEYQVDKGLIDLTDGPGTIALNGYDFRIVFDKAAGQIIRYSYKGKELMNGGPALNFRALVPPEDSLKANYDVWNEASEDAQLVDYKVTEDVNGNYFVSFTKVLLGGDARMFQNFRIDGRGAILVENVFVKMQGDYPLMPGFGTSFHLPGAYERMAWYGREPGAANEMGIYEGPVDQYTESDKGDVRWVKLTRNDGFGLLIRKEGGPLHLTAKREMGMAAAGGANTVSAADSKPNSPLWLSVDFSQKPLPFQSLNFSYRMIPYADQSNF